MDGSTVSADARSEFVKLATRLLLEESGEAEARDALGREYYRHGAGDGHRNGYRAARLRSAEASIKLAVPQVDGLRGWRSQVCDALCGSTEELERLAIEMYACALSVRNIECTFTDRSGRCRLTRSAVLELAEQLWSDNQAFSSRDLSAHRVLYPLIDGVAERVHLRQPRESVLAAWSITVSGQKVLLGLAPATKEDTARCRDFPRDLKARGLQDQLLVATDGAPGLIRAVEEVLSRLLRQRCLAHKIRNLRQEVPQDRWREVKAQAFAAYTADSPAVARLLRAEFVTRYERELPSATACFLEDFEAAIAHLRMLIAHRRAVRTTNLRERLLGEGRRRTKVIPHAFGEPAVLQLMFASLLRASAGWRRVVISEFELRQLDELRNDLDQEFKQRTTASVSVASRHRIYSKDRT